MKLRLIVSKVLSLLAVTFLIVGPTLWVFQEVDAIPAIAPFLAFTIIRVSVAVLTAFDERRSGPRYNSAYVITQAKSLLLVAFGVSVIAVSGAYASSIGTPVGNAPVYNFDWRHVVLGALALGVAVAAFLHANAYSDEPANSQAIESAPFVAFLYQLVASIITALTIFLTSPLIRADGFQAFLAQTAIPAPMLGIVALAVVLFIIGIGGVLAKMWEWILSAEFNIPNSWRRLPAVFGGSMIRFFVVVGKIARPVGSWKVLGVLLVVVAATSVLVVGLSQANPTQAVAQLSAVPVTEYPLPVIALLALLIAIVISPFIERIYLSLMQFLGILTERQRDRLDELDARDRARADERATKLLEKVNMRIATRRARVESAAQRFSGFRPLPRQES